MTTHIAPDITAERSDFFDEVIAEQIAARTRVERQWVGRGTSKCHAEYHTVGLPFSVIVDVSDALDEWPTEGHRTVNECDVSATRLRDNGRIIVEYEIY